MLNKKACAGTMESGDIFVEIAPLPFGSGIELELSSVVYAQFGEQIQNLIYDTLAELGVTDAKLTAADRGAVDCVIQARVETAVCRAKGED